MSDQVQESEENAQTEPDTDLSSGTDDVIISSRKRSIGDGQSSPEKNRDVRFGIDERAATTAKSKDQKDYNETANQNYPEDSDNPLKDETPEKDDDLRSFSELKPEHSEQEYPDVDSENGSRGNEEYEPSSQEVSPLPTSTKLRMLEELLKMQAADDAKKMLEKQNRKIEKEKIMKQFEEKRKKAQVTILPNVEESKNAIANVLKREIRSASHQERKRLQEETKIINLEIDVKHGLSTKKETDFTALASDFYESKKLPIEMLPSHISRSLTTEEINDLRLVFEMFDPKEKGYITVTDIRRAAAMLGFKAKKKVFVDMIAELAKDSKGRVTFVNFLDFIVRSQGDGPDPYDEILQGFRMLDISQKGYLTFEDIREASERLGVPLSNRAIREMMQEADQTGNGKIGQEDFVRLMMQTNTFKTNLAR